MSKNQVFDGTAVNRLSLYVRDNVLSGQPVRVGDIVGVAETSSEGDFTSNGLVSSNNYNWATVTVRGSFKLEVDTSSLSDDDPGEHNGLPVYIDNAGELTTDENALGAFKFGVILDGHVEQNLGTIVHVGIGI